MKTAEKRPTRKSGEQVIQEKLKDLNEYLKTADLTIVYESMGLPVPKKTDERSNN